MKIKKVPMRMCVVTRERFEKKDLVRIVKTRENEVSIDLSGKANGKGAYIKKDLEVLKKAQKNKILDRVLEINIDDSIYSELEDFISM